MGKHALWQILETGVRFYGKTKEGEFHVGVGSAGSADILGQVERDNRLCRETKSWRKLSPAEL
jgi:hypothetical protein